MIDFVARISCMTYNHAPYISDAMNGFVMQKTNFPFVCTIVDDASTDGEQEVIKEYVQEHFDLQDSSISYEKDTDYGHVTFARHKTNKNCYFAIVYLKENHYSQKKSKAPYLTEWRDTKYIALCEGDDYWTDPLKLQKQVDYLESHPDCVMSTHSVDWDAKEVKHNWKCHHDKECDLTTEECIRNGGLYTSTCSMVFRKELNDDRPEWRKKANIGDLPLQILATLRGKLHFSPETMGVYRYLLEGSWTSLHQMDQNANLEYARNKIMWLGLLDKDTGFMYSKAIYSHLFRYYNRLYKAGEIGFLTYLRAVMKADEKHYKRAFKDFLIKHGKPIYRLWKKKAER